MNFDWTISIPVIISLATLVFAYFRTRRTDVDDRFRTGSKRMDDLSSRVQVLEETVKAMPAKDDVHQLHLTLSEMGGDMKAIRATMRGMSDSLSRTEGIVSRHEDHLRGTK